MIKLKTEVVKKHLIEQLKAEAQLTYKNSWQPKLQERAFIDGAEALFKLLRLGDVSDSDLRFKIEEDKSLIYDSKTDKDICMYFDSETRDWLLNLLNTHIK